MMNDTDVEVCNDCGDFFDLYDGFLGNVDQTDERCSFMTNIVALCKKCAENRGIMMNDAE